MSCERDAWCPWKLRTVPYPLVFSSFQGYQTTQLVQVPAGVQMRGDLLCLRRAQLSKLARRQKKGLVSMVKRAY